MSTILADRQNLAKRGWNGKINSTNQFWLENLSIDNQKMINNVLKKSERFVVGNTNPSPPTAAVLTFCF